MMHLVPKTGGIPAVLVKSLIEEWKREYGPTYPLYGKDTIRNDISGSVRPLLSTTEIPHAHLLAERSGVSRRQIQKIMDGEIEVVKEEVVEKLVRGMDREDFWYVELEAYL